MPGLGHNNRENLFLFFLFRNHWLQSHWTTWELSVYLYLPGWMILWRWTRFASDQTTCLNSFVFTPAALWLCCSLSCSSGSDLTYSQICILLPVRIFPLVFWLVHFWHFQPGFRGRSVSLRLSLKSPYLELQRRGDMQDTYVIMEHWLLMPNICFFFQL